MEQKWWQKENIYQIYLRSFYDSNNDGIGDIQGVTQKLEYFKSLGIGILWISPHYDSPMDDNGYDVRNYYKVSEDYGTIEDFRDLLHKAHALGIKIITDLVLNHTSDEHEWFIAAKDPQHPNHIKYHDYYIWQKPKFDSNGNKIKPTRWIGWFGDSTWEYNPPTDEYYLHIFSKKMPDLNWRNELLREDMKKMIRWWLDQGINGFRVDASNHLEKNWDFPDGFPGYENFSSIPRHHDYLHELGKEIFVPYDVLTIGESGGASKEEALKYAGYGSNEFNMLIHFGHCWADVDNHDPRLMGKWSQGNLRVASIKRSYQHWYEMLEGKGWNIIYWHNHDQPRVVSHYGNDSEYHDKSAKMLATSLYFMSGTAICYQGEEIGMTNVKYNQISQFRDVEVFTEYQNFLDRGFSKQEALEIIQSRCRDNARTPMQWNSEQFAGFSKHLPWIDVNSDYTSINVVSQNDDPDSVLNVYRMILKYRVENSDIMNGKVRFIELDDENHYCYENIGEKTDHLILTNFREFPVSVNLSMISLEGYNLLYTNESKGMLLSKEVLLDGYSAYVYVRDKIR